MFICVAFIWKNDIYEWSRDHRVHHKFSETDADPHNACRGFFFAHVGWLFCKKHPEVKRRGKTVDVSDLLQAPVVVYQRKWVVPAKTKLFECKLIVTSFVLRFYIPLVLTLCFALPALNHIRQMKKTQSRLLSATVPLTGSNDWQTSTLGWNTKLKTIKIFLQRMLTAGFFKVMQRQDLQSIKQTGETAVF